MKSLVVCLMALMIFIQSDANQQPTVSGHVRLSDGLPVAGAQVMLFDVADLRRGVMAYATTDEAGQFVLPLAALGRLPQGFALGTNYPNPFNPATIIPYELAATSPVKLEVFNILGQWMATLVDGEQGAGSYQAQWDGTDAAGQAAAAGLYFYRLTVDGVPQTGRMVLVDGQAGVPMRGAGVESLSAAESLNEAYGTYGLVVSGPGMVAYVDAEFGVEAGMGPVDIAVEARRDAPLTEPVPSGILGDVDNNGQVDIADGLLVAAYSVNPATALPNSGDVNGDNQTDITDAWLLATYKGDLAAWGLSGRGKAVGTLATGQEQTFSLPGGASMEFVRIEPGTFQMGAPSSESGRWDDEGPVHEVEISRGFWLGKYEVTQGEWEAVVGSNPSSYTGNARRPVEMVSWNDVHEFIGRLNDAAGDSLYRLPSEAEWEYACRAGTSTRWSFGDDESRLGDYAWYDCNDGCNTKAVGGKLPNAWGLYDMQGNVWEWVQDWFEWGYYNTSPRVDPPGPTSGAHRVGRGGSFAYTARHLRVANRIDASPDYRDDVAGFRLLRMDSGQTQLPIQNPDLSVVALASPSSIPEGQSVTVAATVINQGDGSAAGTTVRFYRSSDATIDASDMPVGNNQAVSGLAASASSTVSTTDAPPTAGTYYYGACVDAVSNESNTSNNCSAGVPVIVQPAGAPDLAVTVLVSPSSITEGQSVTLSATVGNQGNAVAAGTTLRFYRSSDATIDSNDLSVGSSQAVSSLAALASSTVSTTDAPAPAGTYYYGACVDAVSDESNASNNCSAGVPVTVRAAGAPDLAVTVSASPSSITAGESVTLSATVGNQGNAVAAGTTVRFYRSSDATIDTNDLPVGSSQAVSSLAASASSTVSTTDTPAPAGTYYYGACVDAVSDESNATNNCSPAMPVTVQPAGAPDLVVTVSVNPVSITAGEAVSLSATVSNQGNAVAAGTTVRFYRSSDATIDANDRRLDITKVSGLAAGDSSPVLRGVDVPTESYYYGACVDAVSDESNVSNNCSPGVPVSIRVPGAPDLAVTVSVNPSHITEGQSVELSATVSNQGDGSAAETTVRFYRSPDATIDPNDMRVSRRPVSGLAAGASSMVSTTDTPPTTGTYYYGACVDAVSNESNATNNCSSGVPVIVQPQGVPDLAIVASANPSHIIEGESVALSATVSNIGNEVTAGTTVRYYRSPDATIDSNDLPVGSSQAVSSLPAGSTSPVAGVVDTPPTAGEFYYGACVASVSGEGNISNNCSPSVRVEVGIRLDDPIPIPTPGSGWWVKSAWVDNSSPAPGASFTMYATLAPGATPSEGDGLLGFLGGLGDAGTADEEPQALRLDYYRSNDNVWSFDDSREASDEVRVPDELVEFTEDIRLIAPSPGTYYYFACVEPIEDSNPTPNCSSPGVQVTVQTPDTPDPTPDPSDPTPGAPDLVVTASASPNSVTAGQSFTLSATVSNQGNAASAGTTVRYYRSADAIIDPNSDEAIDSQSVVGLTAGGSSMLSIAETPTATAYYAACVDAVTEENNVNNNCSTSVEVRVIRPAGPPDLAVTITEPVDPSSVTVGQSFTLSATVSNQGDGQAAATTLQYYLSLDPTIANNDTPLGSIQQVVSLAAGNSSLVQGVSVIPGGKFYYGACVAPVDGDNNETNNCSPGVQIPGGGALDLVVIEPSVKKTEPPNRDFLFPEEKITVTVKVRNEGDTESPKTKLHYYLSENRGISTGDDELLTSRDEPFGDDPSKDIKPLDPSESTEESRWLKARSTPGRYYYGACVDPVSGESDVDNNCSTGVQVRVLDRPDLAVTITSPANPSSVTVGQSFRLEATVRNQGLQGGWLADTTTLSYYSSLDATIDPNDTPLGSTQTGLLDAGNSGVYGIDVAPTETAYYGACVAPVDGDNNEDNNCSPGVQVTVVEPDLAVTITSPANPSSVPADQSFTLAATVHNQGDGQAAATTLQYYSSSDQNISTIDTPVGSTQAVGSLAAGNNSPVSGINVAPTETAYYGACVVAVPGESNTGNNCSPGVLVNVGAGGSSSYLSSLANALKPLEALEDDYTKNSKKWLAYFSGSTSLGKKNPVSFFVTIYIDLADYMGISPEGRADWVSVWIDFGIGADKYSNSLLPFTLGLTELDFDSNNKDPWRKGVSLSLFSGSVPGFEVSGLNYTIDDSGSGTESFEINLAAQSNISFSFVNLQISTLRFEIKKSYLNAMLTGGALIASLIDGKILKAIVEAIQEKELPFRRFTGKDDGQPHNISGVINAIWGSGYPGDPLSIRFENTGNSNASFRIDADVQTEGWTANSIRPEDFLPGPIPDLFYFWKNEADRKDVRPGKQVKVEFEFDVAIDAPDSAKVLLKFYHDKAFADLLETREVSLYRKYPEVNLGNLTDFLSIDIREGSINKSSNPKYDYTFFLDLDEDSTKDMRITLLNLEADADLHLYKDGFSPRFIAKSENSGTTKEKIVQSLDRGRYYIRVEAEDSGDISYRLQYGDAAVPDLKVSSIDIPSSATGPFNLEVQVENLGGLSGSTHLYYQRRPSGTNSIVKELQQTTVSSLDPDATSDWYSVILTPPRSGDFQYRACVDFEYSQESGSAQDNNCSAWKTVSVTVAQPDLKASISSISNPTTTTGTVTLNVTVSNVKEGTSSRTDLYYQRLTEAEFLTNDWDTYAYNYPADTQTSVAGLSAGSSSSYGVSLDSPSTAGDYRFRACVTKLDNESNTNNNCSAWTEVEVSPPDFSLHPDNDYPTGIAYRSNRFYVVDGDDKKVYVYKANGDRDTDKEFSLHSSNTNPMGITYGSNRFYVPDRKKLSGNAVYKYRSSGNYDTHFSLQESAGEEGTPRGTTYSDRFYIIDSQDKKAYVYSERGGRYENESKNPDFSLYNANAHPAGITYRRGGTFYVVDSQDKKVYVYVDPGYPGSSRDKSKEFSLHPDNAHPAGITDNVINKSDRFYVVDSQDKKVYVYPR